MVYPRRDGSRSLSKFIALCAVTTCLVQAGASAKAHKSALLVNDVSSTCLTTVSDGDAAVGIQIASDSSCASGGLGCIDSVCRFCKLRDTPQSSHLLNCSLLGTFVPPITVPIVVTSIPAPVATNSPTPANVDTGCEYAVSDGDFSVGIELVGDATCAAGGVGCFEGVCRYCKFRETAQSGHLVACSSIGFNFGVTGVPISQVDGTTTAAPTQGSSAPPPPPSSTLPPTNPVGAGCPYAVSDGDAAVGIQLIGDATCSSGGLGCFADVCRYCQARSTPQSSHLLLCKDLGVDFGGDVIPAGATTSPAVVTISPSESPAQTTEAPAVTTGSPLTTDAPPGTTEAPYVTSIPPTTAPTFAPVNVDETPAPSTAAPSSAVDCPFEVSDGDYAAGIQLVGDASCVNGGLGCFQGVCRFCQFRRTPQSGHLLSCKDLDSTSTSTDSNSTDASTDTPAVATADPVTGCPFPVSEGDAAVGIELVGDSTCANGGLGCYQNICRFCKLEDTPQSKHLFNCSDLGYPHTPAPTFATADVNETPAPNVEDGSNEMTPTDAPAIYDSSNVGDTPEPSTNDVPDATPAPSTTDALSNSPSPAASGSLGDETPEPLSTNSPLDDTPPTTSPDLPVDVTSVPTTAPAPDATTEPKTAAPTANASSEPATAPPLVDSSPQPTVPTVSSPSVNTGCEFPVSEGDFAVGIQLVGDASCASGGLGCFQNVCRFCKLRTTPQSAHLISCKDLGYNFGSSNGSDLNDTPTESPGIPTADPATGCPYPVSEGDAAVGIQLVGDATCSGGGLGCFQNVCRFCKLVDTPQSNHLLKCSDFGYPRTSAPTFSPVDVTETPAPTSLIDGATPAPTLIPVPTTPVPSTTAPAIVSTNCTFPVSEGDYSVGIQLVGDASCVSGGLGCFQDICRFCQYRTTAQSGHLLTCAALGYNFNASSSPTTAPSATTSPANTTALPTTCPLSVDEGDFSVGIQLVTDLSCVNGGLGCVADVCRFCKFRETSQSSHLEDCSSFSSDSPTSGDPIGAPTDLSGSGEGPQLCPFTASEGDQNIGVEIITDSDCLEGGIGCFNDVCRFCKVFSTDKSAHLMNCTDFGYNFEPITTSKPPLPGSTTAAPLPDTPAPTSSVSCDQSASEGDKTVGIDMVTDASCITGGVGCLPESVCRYCKFMETNYNAHMEWCSAIEGASYTPAPLPTDVTSAAPQPADTTTAAPPSLATCDQTVSDGDKSMGINLVTDVACLNGGVGCLPDSVCRYCKVTDSSDNAHMVWCSSITGADGSVAPPVTPLVGSGTPVPVDVTTTPSATVGAPLVQCDQAISEGDRNAGIDLVTDLSCVNGGLGCISDSVCRYCKRTETDTSKHLEWCASYGGVGTVGVAVADPTTAPPVDTIAPTTLTDTPAPTLDPSTCSTVVSSGDAEGGVAAVHDETCLNGGIGCFGGVCRFCQAFETDKSVNFIPCNSFVATISPLRAAAKVLSKRSTATSTTSTLDELFNDKTFKWSIVGAACVGVIAVVAIFAIGAKRSLARGSSRMLRAEGVSEETEPDAAAVAADVLEKSTDTTTQEVDV